jgi:FkbM family methyltransferase
LLRKFLEHISRGVVLKRRLPRCYGGCAFYVTPEASLRYWRLNVAKVDATLLNLAAEYVQPGHTVWDLGANVGLFTFAAAGLAGSTGRVFAIEPDLHLVSLLRRSARLARLQTAPIEVLPVAVAGEIALSRLNIAERGRASNFLAGYGQSQAGGSREEQTVLSVSLDWLLTQLPRPDLVKIDCEGAEAKIITGAERLLREAQPIIICEVGAGATDVVSRTLLNANYLIFDADRTAQERSPLDCAPWATLAIPQHKAHLFPNLTQVSGKRPRQAFPHSLTVHPLLNQTRRR